MTRIVGVDPSLVGTGIAVLPHPSTAAPELVPTLVTIGETGSDRDTVATTARRIARTTRAVLQRVPTDTEIALAVIEGLPYGTEGGRHEERAALWWGIAAGLTQRRIPIAVCNTTHRAIWASGSGRGDKAVCTAAIKALWTNVVVRDHNQADALIVAHMAAQRLGWFPIEHPQHDIANRMTWPAGLPDVLPPAPPKPPKTTTKGTRR
ncbi:hypothetical protein [Skermania piniformis]|uniref:Holliday junction nuclease RuvC n=1 Tax=Skermania pinensis TaxID=39122 RepID=A0ABX8SGQ7_9ACTN|nr:hypothetical protein [Skermania piniformis]QXQ14866.1 hypothetical protein KV203_05645 [Skermania piniformis]